MWLQCLQAGVPGEAGAAARQVAEEAGKEESEPASVVIPVLGGVQSSGTATQISTAHNVS